MVTLNPALSESHFLPDRHRRTVDKAHGNIQLLLDEHNGALLLAQALLYADKITFVVGHKINPFYQNPLLPMSVSIRKNLIEKLAERLIKLN